MKSVFGPRYTSPNRRSGRLLSLSTRVCECRPVVRMIEGSRVRARKSLLSLRKLVFAERFAYPLIRDREPICSQVLIAFKHFAQFRVCQIAKPDLGPLQRRRGMQVILKMVLIEAIHKQH